MRWLSLILLPSLAYAGGPDAETLKGMDAELRGDWIQAVESFGRAVQDNPNGATRLRLRKAKARAVEPLSERLGQLLKEERWEEAARCTALARLISPKGRMVRRAQSALKRAKVAVPDTPGEEGMAVFPTRSARGRTNHMLRFGAAGARAESIKRGCLGFLVGSQEKEGHWDSDKFGGREFYDCGVTALALMALLSDGPTALEGPHRASIEKAAEYLKNAQGKEGFGPASSHFIYDSAFTTQALAEYAILADKTKEFEGVLTKARDFLQSARSRDAGWRYEPRSGKSDTSITCCVVTALHRLELAGLAIHPAAYQGALAWINKMTDNEFGQTGYLDHGGASSRPEGLQDKFPMEHTQAMTAAGCIVRAYAGGVPTATSIALIEEVPPDARYPDFYYWFFGARAFQARAGSVPASWYEALVEAAQKYVEPDGSIAPVDVWSRSGGRIYATAMCALALASPYREPPPRSGDGWTMSEFLGRRTRSVKLSARPGIAGTGIYFDISVPLKVQAFGIMRPSEHGQVVRAGGMKDAPAGAKRLVKKAPYACLLGRVGLKGKLFRIVENEPFTTKECGPLYVLTNVADRTTATGHWKIVLEPAD